MSLECGVYRQKPYGWQVWRQREPHSPYRSGAAGTGCTPWCGSPAGGKVAPPCFRPGQDLACLLK